MAYIGSQGAGAKAAIVMLHRSRSRLRSKEDNMDKGLAWSRQAIAFSGFIFAKAPATMAAACAKGTE